MVFKLTLLSHWTTHKQKTEHTFNYKVIITIENNTNENLNNTLKILNQHKVSRDLIDR